MSRSRKNIFYLDLNKARKGGYLVDRKEYFDKYAVPGNKYEMLKGCPLVRSIEGTLIYDSDIESLFANIMDKARYQRYAAFGKTIILKWKRG